MPQHDYVIDDQAGLQFLADLNAVIAAIVSSNSGATAPATTFAYQWWADTTAGILKRRNAANSMWISVMSLTTGLIIGTDVQAYMPAMSQAEAEAGAESALRSMSPLRVKQAIAALSSSSAQIQQISASVAANALTISASALSLSFRSTTLGSGAVTTVSGTPSNLVISSGSTLGTVSAQQSDIAVLALNNAGTIELAAVNLSGGMSLDETGLISTTAEGGAGAADSATVAYSTTARSNLAYRVIGVIRSTQTTAGTWAAAPSLIQGVGGQAFASMHSLGYGQTWQNVMGSRTYGTTYYNTTGKPICVKVATANSSTGYYLYLSATVNGLQISNDGCWVQSGITVWVRDTFIVPPGGSYSVAVTGGNTPQYWSELR